jgi:C-terminal processing protease CtpA/Prc
METKTIIDCSNMAAVPVLGISDLKPVLEGGLVVQKLDRFGSCAKAGVVVGDEIFAIDGEVLPAEGVEEVAQGICARIGIGGTVQLRIRRAGEEMEVPVRLLAKKSLTLNIQEISEVLERKIAP